MIRIPTLDFDFVGSSLESILPSQLVSRAFDLAHMTTKYNHKNIWFVVRDMDDEVGEDFSNNHQP